MIGSDLWQLASTVPATWYDVKMGIEGVGAVSDDALHVIVGVALQLVFALILRRSLASWRPIIPVLCLLLFNEAVDLWAERWPSLAMQLGEGAKDLALTMVVPLILMAALRLRKHLPLYLG